MFKKVLLVIAVCLSSLMIAPSASAVESVSVSSKASDYSTKKKNQFWRVVTSYDPTTKIAGKKRTVDLGIATCDLLRAGGDLTDLAEILYESNAGYVEDSIMVIMAAAPVILCPDQQYKFE